MFIITESVDINRLILIIISKYIHENKSKINLLTTCKFMHGLRFEIFYYQRVTVTNINLNIFDLLTRLTRLTSIHFYKIMPTPTLTNNLTYLKLTGEINLNFIFDQLPPKLKCLILDTDNNDFLALYKKIKPLNISIEHFGLYVKKFDCDINIIKKIIPNNIKYFEFNVNKLFNTICDHPTLTKIKYDVNNCYYPSRCLKKIPPNITSVSYVEDYYYLNKNDFSYSFYKFLSCINENVIELRVTHYTDNMYKNIPSTISKLKINNLRTNQKLPRTIQFLQIKKIILANDKLLSMDPNIKKLIVSYEDRYLLDPNVYVSCDVKYKFN